MAYVCGALALGLLVAAWRHRGGWRVWFLACAGLNAWAAASMIASGYEYAWRLLPPL